MEFHFKQSMIFQGVQGHSATQNEFENYSKMKWSLTNRILSSFKIHTVLCCSTQNILIWGISCFKNMKIFLFISYANSKLSRSKYQFFNKGTAYLTKVFLIFHLKKSLKYVDSPQLQLVISFSIKEQKFYFGFGFLKNSFKQIWYVRLYLRF